MRTSDDVTILLEACRNGDRSAEERLLPLVYEQLHLIAQQQRRRQRGNVTIDTTEVVSEAYIRLFGGRLNVTDRVHFYNVAALAMRKLLIDLARRRRAKKRDRDAEVTLRDDDALAVDDNAESLIALDEALARLEQIDARLTDVVKYRFYLGLTIQETAQVLGTSPATVKRQWGKARAWLFKSMRDG